MGVDYGIKIPVEVVGEQSLKNIYESLRGVDGATSKLTSTQREFAKAVREGLNEGQSYNKILGDMRKKSSDATEGFKQMAGGLQEYIARTKEAEASTSRLQQIVGKIGGRLGGIASGVPGGGFIGGQLVGGLGLSGGSAAALGIGAAGLFGAFEIGKQVTELGKWAQEQQNAARAIGITITQQEQLSRVSERTGVNLNGVAKATAKLSEEMVNGGARAKEIQIALGQLGLGGGVAFQNPASAIDTIAAALAKIPDEGQRATLAVRLLGESGRELASIAQTLASEKGLTNLIPENQMKNLIEARSQIKLLGEEWDLFIAKLAKPAVMVLKWMSDDPGEGAIQIQENRMRSLGLLGENEHLPRPGGNKPEAPSSAETDAANAKAGRVSNWHSLLGRYGTPGDRNAADLSDIDVKQKAFMEDYAAGKHTDAEARQAVAQFEGQRRAIQARGPIDSFNRSMLTKGDDPVSRIFQERDNLAKEYGIGRGSNAYQDISGTALVGASKELSKGKESDDKMMERMNIEGGHEISKFGDEAYKEELKKFNDYSKDLAERLGKNYKTTLEVNKIEDSSVREGLTKQAGRSQRFAAQTDQSPLAGLDIQLSLAQKLYDLDMKTVDADKLVLDYNKQRVDLAKAEADLRKASTDALIDAESKILEIRKQQEDQIKNTFTSIILGAQNGGSKGALSAVKSTFEGYEKTILGNLLGSNFLNIGGNIPHADANSGFGKLLQGTPFGSNYQKDLATIDNTLETKLNTAALAKLDATVGKVTANSSVGGVGIDGLSMGNPSGYGLGDTASNDAVSIANQVSSVSGVGTSVAKAVAAPLSAAGGIFASLSKALGGAKYAGNFDAITNGVWSAPDANGISTATPLSTGQEIGAIAGTAGLAFGAYQGIATAAKGGAKNVAGGIGGALGAIAPFTGPAAPFVAAAGALAGLVSAILPDPKTVRANQIAKNIFDQQYLAPQAITVSEGANGGYADLGANGQVRSSNFSPYPIVDQSYLDTGRGTRIVVPGHQTGSFGGYTSTQGTTVGPPTYHMIIQAFDSKDVMAHGKDIVDAFHAHIMTQSHPVVNDLARQTGARR